MKKLIPIAIILIALITIAWYYAGSKGSPQATQNIEEATALLVGTWQSVDDPQSIVVFEEGGIRRDLYDGAEPEPGTWEIRPQSSEGDDLPGLLLVSMFAGEEFEYSIWNVSESELVLNYLARGNTLSYTRIDDALSQDLQQYVNDEYNFVLSHPTHWEVQEALKPREQYALHEVVIWEKEYDMWRGSVALRIFSNEEEMTVHEWWNAWLSEEDAKEVACREEYGDESPCLFLRDRIEREDPSVLSGNEAITVGIFQFDHEEECTYAAHGSYVYGICAPAAGNPNDPKAAEHRAIAERMQASFEFTEPK